MAETLQGGLGRHASALAALVAAGLLAACGGGATSPRPSATGRASVAPAPDYRYLNPAVFPETDTPLAQASAELKAVWTPYDVTLIPSRHVLDNMPTPPKVINKTNGGLSDADAEALAWAEYRENAFIGWMEANVQPGLNGHLRVDGLFAGATGNAARGGTAVNDPPCDLFAQEIAVVPATSDVVQFEAGKGYQVTAPYALVDMYQGNCTVKTAGGQTLFVNASPSVDVEVGSIRHDDVLGDVFFSEGGRPCDPGATLLACGALH